MEWLELSGKADTTSGDECEVDGKKEFQEEREKCRMRGKGKSLKQYLRKQRKDVIDTTVVRRFFFIGIHIHDFFLLVAIRAKLEKQKEEKWWALAVLLLERRKDHLLWIASKMQSDLWLVYGLLHRDKNYFHGGLMAR